MRRLVVNTFVTLDGIMQAPGGPDEDPAGGFAHGGWSVNYWDEQMGQAMSAFMGKPFELLLGRKTYEIFAAYWPYAKDEPGADQLNSAKKYVVSRTLKEVGWNNSHLIKGEVVQAVRQLKEQAGPELQVHGSGNLIQTLLQHNLIDAFGVWIFPVVIGRGQRLFDQGILPAGLKLVSSQSFSTGVLLAVYEPAGALKTGSFALNAASEAEPAQRERLAAGGAR